MKIEEAAAYGSRLFAKTVLGYRYSRAIAVGVRAGRLVVDAYTSKYGKKPPDFQTGNQAVRICDYRKMYFSTNSSARTYIRGVTFLALPVTAFRTT